MERVKYYKNINLPKNMLSFQTSSVDCPARICSTACFALQRAIVQGRNLPSYDLKKSQIVIFFKHYSVNSIIYSTVLYFTRIRQYNIGCFTLDEKRMVFIIYISMYECKKELEVLQIWVYPIIISAAKYVVGRVNSNDHDFRN